MPKSAIPLEILKEKIPLIEDHELRALIGFQYVLGARIGELVPYLHSKRRYKKIDNKYVLKKESVRNTFNTLGLQITDFVEKEDYYEVVKYNFKQKDSKKRRLKTWIFKKIDGWIIPYTIEWAKNLNKQVLFLSWTPRQARGAVTKEISKWGFDPLANKPYSSHNLRASRTVHLMSLAGLNPQETARVLGHTSLNSTLAYTSTEETSIINKIIKGDEKYGKQ